MTYTLGLQLFIRRKQRWSNMGPVIVFLTLHKRLNKKKSTKNVYPNHLMIFKIKKQK